MEQENQNQIPPEGLTEANVLKVPEVGLTSMLMAELRALVKEPKYDHLATSELIGVLEMLKFEYLYRWME